MPRPRRQRRYADWHAIEGLCQYCPNPVVIKNGRPLKICARHQKIRQDIEREKYRTKVKAEGRELREYSRGDS